MRMEFQSELSTGESIIVVNDVKRCKKCLEALEWAINHVVRPKDTVIFLGVLSEVRKKSSAACFPFHMGIGIPGSWVKLDVSGQDDTSPAVLEEIEKMRADYQYILHPFYKQCMKSEVNLEVKLAAGFDPRKITIEEAYKCNPRWIVLESQLKKERVYIYGNVACNVAIMKKKGIATLMPLRYPEEGRQDWRESQSNDGEVCTVCELHQLQDECVEDSQIKRILPPPTPDCPCWDQLAWKSGFPRCFSITELEEMTNGFSNENVIIKKEGLIIYEGILMGTPVWITCYPGADDCFWVRLELLSRIRHQNVLNIVGHCSTTCSLFFIYDYPCSGTLEMNLKDDESSRKLSWKARWHIALEIGAGMRYLQEEWGAEGPVVNICVSSSTVVLFHGSSAKICLSNKARRFKDCRSCNEDSSSHEFQAIQEHLLTDIRAYGRFLMEIITGMRQKFSEQSNYESSIDFALAHLERGSLTEVIDQRIADPNDAVLVQNMVQAAVICLQKDLDHELTMSEILAIIRGSAED